ncbi:MAG: SUMF1/EgtB/PvdO family nonheme iron enzyme [Pseudomonadota bacterium]
MSNPIDTLIWRHGGSEVRFDHAQFPVVIGTASAADIRLAGPGGQTLAQLDLLQGNVFIQPLLKPSPVTLDGETLSGNTFLQTGQQIEVYGLNLQVTMDDDVVTLDQDSRAGAFTTQPPQLQAQASDDILTAADWQPATAAAPVEKRSRTVGAIAASALAVLVATVWWLTTAVSLRIETLPATPDSVEVEGPGLSIPVAGRWLLRPGVHRVRLRSAGYADLTRDIDVDGSLGSILLEQQPLPGELVVSARATSGTVRLTDSEGNQYEQALPARFEGLLPATYDIAISAPGYLDWQDQVLVAGLQTRQHLDVALVSNRATIGVQTEPAGASVFAVADGAALTENTPGAIELTEGRHEVLYQLDGYKPVKRTYIVLANTSVSATPVTFEPADALLSVSSVPGAASVTLDGQYQGRTPIKLALEPDRRYELRLTRQGYASVTRRVSLPAASQDSVSIDMSARRGEITIRTVPTDAVVFVNGRELGRGTVQADLPAEPQRIRVSRQGYVDFTTVVTPRPGFSQTVDARLQTPEQVALAKIDQEITVFNEHTMRYIRGGTFKRGSSRREADRRSNEPLRDVRVTRAFYVATHEVSNRQFAAFRRNHDSRGDVYASLAGDRNPVVNVSWQDAAAYCNWLSEKEGLTPAYVGEFGELAPVDEPVDGYRLPTEAEWVWIARYAGRPGNPRRFGWGGQLPPPEKTANIADDSAESLLDNRLNGYRDSFPASAPVGSFAANAAGLFDLDGNVAEWMHDIYEIHPSVDGPLIDYRGPAKGSANTIRGASWRSANVSRLRLAYREGISEPRDDIGFRIVRDAGN